MTENNYAYEKDDLEKLMYITKVMINEHITSEMLSQITDININTIENGLTGNGMFTKEDLNQCCSMLEHPDYDYKW